MEKGRNRLVKYQQQNDNKGERNGNKGGGKDSVNLLYQPYLCAEPEVKLLLPPSFADANATSLL